MLDTIAQIGITIFGIISITMVAKKNKWGFVIGLISQPFYFITAIINQQWGVFVTTVIYTFSWLLGIYEWFYKDKKKKA